MPKECDNVCHTYRLYLYMSYSVFLGVLIFLALVHFIMFLLTRRRIRSEAKDYAARKQEFVTQGFPEIYVPESRPAEASVPTNKSEPKDDARQQARVSIQQPQPSTSHSPPDEAPIAKEISLSDNESPKPKVPTTRSSSSSEGSRMHTVKGALQEPVIVTVATVSALFQNEMINNPIGRRRSRARPASADSSVIDISDLVGSPGSGDTPMHKKGRDVDIESAWDEIECGVLEQTKAQMLSVHVGGGAAGYTRGAVGGRIAKLRFEDSSLSVDAVYPATHRGRRASEMIEHSDI